MRIGNEEEVRVREQQLRELFARLDSFEVCDEIKLALREDLEVEKNIVRFAGEIRSLYTGHEIARIDKTLDLALNAHAGQTQSLRGRGLTSIPYANHVVQVARWTLAIGGDPDTVIVGLLHDVLEDTDVAPRMIEQQFGAGVLRGVGALTRGRDISRAEFLEHIRGLTSPYREVKFLDRYHNLIRGFTVEDTNYLDRYLRETESVYRPMAKSLDLTCLPLSFDKVVAALGEFCDGLKGRYCSTRSLNTAK